MRCLAGRIGAALAVAVFATGVFGLPPAKSQQIETAPARHFKVIRYKSVTFAWPRPFATAVAGNVDIADVLPMSDRQLYIQGKKVGTTNISLYDQNKIFVGVIDLDVTLDTEEIKRRICPAPRAAASAFR